MWKENFCILKIHGMHENLIKAKIKNILDGYSGAQIGSFGQTSLK